MDGGKSARRLAWAVAVVALLFGPSALPASAATSIVQMVNFSFQPPSLTNNVGDTVLWSNTTITAHNVVSSNSVWAPVAPFTNPATFQVTFSAAGTYGYFCSPHHLFGMTGTVLVRTGSRLPVVALTNPPAGSILAEPATIKLEAAASESGGSVTNVEFFSSGVSLGRDASSPYSLTVSNLPAAVYSFTAKATDNLGASTTSDLVNVTVVTPGPIRFDTNLVVTAGSLPLRVSVTPGLSYAIESSTDLTTWQPYATFVATNSTMSLGTSTTGDNGRLFRARLLPNP